MRRPNNPSPLAPVAITHLGNRHRHAPSISRRNMCQMAGELHHLTQPDLIIIWPASRIHHHPIDVDELQAPPSPANRSWPEDQQRRAEIRHVVASEARIAREACVARERVHLLEI